MGGNGGTVVVCLSVAILLSGCTGDGETPGPAGTPTPSADPEEAFIDELESLCGPFSKAEARVRTAKGRGQLAASLDRAIDAEEDLLDEARDLAVPQDLKRPFKRYVALMRESIRLRHQVVIESKNLAAAVKDDLRLAQSEKKMYAVAQELGLGPSCPPLEAEFVDYREFTAKTNAGCFKLYQKIKKSETLKQSLVTRTTARNALATLLDFQQRISDVILRLKPKDLNDELVDRLLSLLKERAAVLRELISDFDNYDQSAYESDFKRYEALWKKINKVSDKLNVEACAYVVPRS